MKIKENKKLVWTPAVEVNLVGDSRAIEVEGELIGYGTALERLNLSALEYTPSLNASGKSGYLFTSKQGKITLDTIDIKDIGFSKSNSIINISNGEITINRCSAVSKFELSKLRDSSFIEEQNKINGEDCFHTDSIVIDMVENSHFIYSGDNEVLLNPQGGISIDVEYFLNSTLSNGKITFHGAKKIENSNLYSSMIDIPKLILASNLENSNLAYGNDSVIKFSSIDTNTTFTNSSLEKNSYNFSHNYWGTTDINTIHKQTNYTQILSEDETRQLYPIISSADIYNADFDKDTIPDYIDSDNDNDGYSDLQEDKESEYSYKQFYNPLDDTSFPTTSIDTDYDGTPNSLDEDDDNDGLSDMDEINYQTNPLIANSDGDKMSDYEEIIYKYDPTDKSTSALIGDLSDSHIDSSYENSEGVVYIIGESSNPFSEIKDGEVVYSKFSNITIENGLTIVLEKDTNLTIANSNLKATKENPIEIKSITTGGHGRLIIDNTKINHMSIKLPVHVDIVNGSSIFYSDIEFESDDKSAIGEGTSIKYSFINGKSKEDGASWKNYGYISNSYITGNSVEHSYPGMIENSYLDTVVRSYSKINSSFIDTLRVHNKVKIENSIVGNFYPGPLNYGVIIGSDVWFAEDGILNFIFDNIYISLVANPTLNYSGFGSPIDQKGDKNPTTQFSLESESFLIDGITNPRTEPNFPSWIQDPSVKQYFWNPLNVGTKWNSMDPNSFP